jgi:hypothetical protein
MKQKSYFNLILVLALLLVLLPSFVIPVSAKASPRQVWFDHVCACSSTPAAISGPHSGAQITIPFTQVINGALVTRRVVIKPIAKNRFSRVFT